MNSELPTVIAAFFQAHNSGQTQDFKTLFTDDAIVRDESQEYRGAAIKEWMDEAAAKYQPQADVTHVATVGEQTIATAGQRQFSGQPDATPLQLHAQEQQDRQGDDPSVNRSP